MTELNLSEIFLTGIIVYGPPALGLALLLGALGIPLPGTLLILAAGAFVRQEVLNWPAAGGLGLLGAVLGDSGSYLMGRFASGWVERRFGQSAAWQSARITFERRGGLAIYLTRFLVTPLAIPTNLIAGSGQYAFWRFLVYDVFGELTWIVGYGSLGYWFGSQWELINQFISDFSGLLVGIIILGVGLYFLVRRWWQYKQAKPALESEV